MKKPYVLVHPDGKEDFVQANETKTIGRHPDCDISTLEEHVSGHHATVKHEANGIFYVWDNKSSNWTFVKRGKEKFRVEGKTQLYNNDIVYLSQYYHLKVVGQVNLEAREKAEQRARLGDTEIDIEVPPELTQNQTH